MDVKQKLVGDRPGTESGDGTLDELSRFFHTAVRQLDVEEGKFNIIAETLFRLFREEFGGFLFYVPLSAPRFIGNEFEKHYRLFKSGYCSADQISAIYGCSRRHIHRLFKRFDDREKLGASQVTQSEKQRILDGGVGTGKSKTQFIKLSGFFHGAVRQLDIEESKFDTIAKHLLLLFLTSFGSSNLYVPVLKKLGDDKGWQECFIKYKSGTYSIEKIAKLMNVSQRHVYRKLKAMTESERQARRQNAEAAPSFRSK